MQIPLNGFTRRAKIMERLIMAQGLNMNQMKTSELIYLSITISQVKSVNGIILGILLNPRVMLMYYKSIFCTSIPHKNKKIGLA